MRALPFLALVVLLDAPRPASACSLIENDVHQLDTAHASDTVAPSPVTASTDIHRSADTPGCAGVTSCGDIASIAITVEATDDAAPVDMLGYQLRVVSGDLPAGLGVPTDAVMSNGGDNLYLYFNYGDRSGFSFDLEIRARDLNGNLGPATVITVSEPGESGCSAGHAPLGHASMLGGALLALALVVRKRRR